MNEREIRDNRIDNGSEAPLGEALRDAYSVGPAPNSLRQRVEAMADRPEPLPMTRPFRLRLARSAAAALLVAVLGATLAWRYYFGRPGETAIQLIPADAAVVVTLDTNPSASQAPLFLRIRQSLLNAHMDRAVDGIVSQALANRESPLSSAMRPYLTTNFAFALLPAPTTSSLENGQPVVFLAVKDSAQVENVLARSAQRFRRNRLTYYRLKAEQFATVIDDYLIYAQTPAVLERMLATREGGLPPVADLKEYQEARAELPEDANLMVFLSPAALAAMNEQGKRLGVTPFHDTRWMACSATLRDEGIALDYRAPAEADAYGRFVPMAQAPAIDSAAFKELPAGPYGVFALSDPAAYGETVLASPDTGQARKTGPGSEMREFERETGISIANDILPAFRGRTWLACYPNTDDPAAYPEALVVIDNANGASPAALAAKVRAWLEKLTSGNGRDGVRFMEARQGDTTIWRLDEKTRRKLDEASRSALDVVAGEEDNDNAGDGKSKASGTSWTPCVAQIGGTIVIASTDWMLSRALAAHQGLLPTLDEDAVFARMRQFVKPGAQGVLLVDTAHIMRDLEPHLRKWMKGAPIAVDDLAHLFGSGPTGLVASGSFDGKTQRGSLFLPVDYERFVRVLRAVMDQDDNTHRDTNRG